MSEVRKTLGRADSPYIISLMRLIKTQSKATVALWCMDYAERFILPIYQKTFPSDIRPKEALTVAREWFEGKRNFLK